MRLRVVAASGPAFSLFVLNFVAAKALIYCLPLILAAFCSAEIYGGLELGWSTGLLAATLAIGAPLAGFTQRYLVSRQTGIVDELPALCALASAGSLILLAVAVMLGATAEFRLAVASFGGAVLMNGLSTWCRTTARGRATAWADGSATLAGGAVVALAALAGTPTIAAVTGGYAILTGAVFLASLAIYRRLETPGLSARLALSGRVGLPMVLLGFILMWPGVGGRLIIGLLDASGLAAFGVAFRIAGLALAFQQLLQTAWFARLYVSRTREADRLLAGALAVSAVALAGLTLVGPLLLRQVPMTALSGDGYSQVEAILPSVAVQVFFWIGTALLQQRLNRARLAWQAILPNGLVLAGGVAVILIAGRVWAPPLDTLSRLLAVHNAAFFAVNAGLLARRGLPHRRVMATGLVAGGGLALLDLLVASIR